MKLENKDCIYMREFNNHGTEKLEVDLLYFDLKYSTDEENNAMVAPQTFNKKIHLTKIDENVDLKLLAANFLLENIKDDVIFNLDLSQFDEDQKLNKFAAKVSSGSYYIATNGRIGPATTIVSNIKIKETYLDKNIVKNYTYVVNNNLSDDVIFLLRHGDIDSPGYKFLYSEQKDGLYGEIISVGIHPEHQALKICIKH